MRPEHLIALLSLMSQAYSLTLRLHIGTEVLLNCENAKKLIRYTSSINYYLFYDDLVKFKKNKEEIKKKFIKSLVDLIIKEYAKTAMGKQAGDIAKNFLQKGGIKIPKIKLPKKSPKKSRRSPLKRRQRRALLRKL